MVIEQLNLTRETKPVVFAALGLIIFLTDAVDLSQRFEEPHRHHTWVKDMLPLAADDVTVVCV